MGVGKRRVTRYTRLSSPRSSVVWSRVFCWSRRAARLGELGIPLKRKAGRLSGGQQAQLALTLALARRPKLLLLDEPVAMLDPIARHDFMATVLTAAADDGVSAVLSSHVLAELKRVADYLILMSWGRVQAEEFLGGRQRHVQRAVV